MEHKRKLMSTASCESEGVGSKKKMIDRISNLPDQVAHHILSFLAMPHLACFGCVSKRCRELSLSVPSLDFDEFSEENVGTCRDRQMLLNYLDRFLVRRGDNKIQRFRLCLRSHYVDEMDEEEPCSCDGEYFRMISWILIAVRCNVEELDIDISGDAVTPMFPPSVCLSRSLVSLTVDLTDAVFTVPSFSFSSNLKYLEFKNGTVDEGVFKWISCCCKSIQELVIDEVSVKNITIESSSLEKVSFVNDDSVHTLDISGGKIEEIVIDWAFHSSLDKSVNICAPSLKYLNWEGGLMDHRNLGSLGCLEEAELLLVLIAEDFGNPFDILCSLSRVKILTLNEAAIKGLFREGCRLPPLDNVCDLCMDSGSFVDELVPAVVSLFKILPNLRNLYIRSGMPLFPQSSASTFDLGYWKMQNFAFIHQLEKVTIELSHGSNGVELARYFLENAENLEKMLIVHLPENLEDLVSKFNKINIISNATVLYKEKVVEVE